MNKNIKYASIAVAIVMAVLAIGAVATVGLAVTTLAQGNMSSNMTNATGGNMTNSSSSGGGGG